MRAAHPSLPLLPSLPRDQDVHAGDGATNPTGSGSTSTSQPFEVGIPVPSVPPPMSRQVGGPYGTKIMPTGTFPSVHWNVASPCWVRTRTFPPGVTPTALISSGCIVSVLTIAWYSG